MTVLKTREILMVTDRVSVWVVLRASNLLRMVEKLMCKLEPHLMCAQVKGMSKILIELRNPRLPQCIAGPNKVVFPSDSKKLLSY